MATSKSNKTAIKRNRRSIFEVEAKVTAIRPPSIPQLKTTKKRTPNINRMNEHPPDTTPNAKNLCIPSQTAANTCCKVEKHAANSMSIIGRVVSV